MRTFVSNISALFPMGPKNIVTSYISFSNDAPMLNYLPLNASLSGEGFAGKVRNFLMNSGGTATWAGLREAQAEFALNGRDAADGAAQMVIVLTDGLSQIPAQTAAKAAELRASGVLVAAVGVGPIMGPQGGAACGPLGPASGCNTAVCSAQQCNARQEVFNLAARSDLVWANQWTDLTPESPILVSLLNAAYLAPIIPPQAVSNVTTSLRCDCVIYLRFTVISGTATTFASSLTGGGGRACAGASATPRLSAPMALPQMLPSPPARTCPLRLG